MISIGLKFKIDGVGVTHEVTGIASKKVLDITSPKIIHVKNSGNVSQGSPVDLKDAEDLIKFGYWVLQ